MYDFFLEVFYLLPLRDSQNDMLMDPVLSLGPGSILNWSATRMYVMPGIIHDGRIHVHKINEDGTVGKQPDRDSTQRLPTCLPEGWSLNISRTTKRFH
jgi:hypothetical protein